MDNFSNLHEDMFIHNVYDETDFVIHAFTGAHAMIVFIMHTKIRAAKTDPLSVSYDARQRSFGVIK